MKTFCPTKLFNVNLKKTKISPILSCFNRKLPVSNTPMHAVSLHKNLRVVYLAWMMFVIVDKRMIKRRDFLIN